MGAVPLVSVVIVNYNYGRFLAQCIDSVLAQSYPAIEVIVVDDGSTDRSLEVLHAYSRITIVRQNNKGVSAARNAGIHESKGDWIAFADADDWWQPEKLQEQSRYFSNRSLGMVYCGLEHVDASGSRLGYTRPCLTEDLLPQLVTLKSPPIGGSTAVVRAACLQTVGRFDETLAASEDVDMWIRIASCYDVQAVPAPLVMYRRHSGSLSSQVPLFECNTYRVLTKAFNDPKCARVHHLRPQAFGSYYMILAGSYFHRGASARAMRCALKALRHNPREVSRLLGFPIRVLKRSAGLIP